MTLPVMIVINLLIVVALGLIAKLVQIGPDELEQRWLELQFHHL